MDESLERTLKRAEEKGFIFLFFRGKDEVRKGLRVGEVLDMLKAERSETSIGFRHVVGLIYEMVNTEKVITLSQTGVLKELIEDFLEGDTLEQPNVKFDNRMFAMMTAIWINSL